MTRILYQFGRTLLLIVSLVCGPHSALAGKLDRAGDNARHGSSSSSSSSSGSGSSSSSSSWSSSDTSGDDSGEDALDAATVMVVGYGMYYSALALTSPWWLPHGLLEGDLPDGSAGEVRFANHPYAQGAQGHILRPPALVYGWDGIARSSNGDRVQPRKTQRVAMQLGFESGVGVSDGVMRLGMRARVQFPLRLQLDTDWSLFREHDRDGVDIAMLGRELFSVRFAESPNVFFYSGAGVQHLCDAQGCEHGIDVTYGFEAFPGRPIVFSLEGSLGNVGQAFAPGVRTRLGFLVGPVEASLGWHQRWIGDVPLGGPCLGITGWF